MFDQCISIRLRLRPLDVQIAFEPFVLDVQLMLISLCPLQLLSQESQLVRLGRLRVFVQHVQLFVERFVDLGVFQSSVGFEGGEEVAFAFEG